MRYRALSAALALASALSLLVAPSALAVNGGENATQPYPFMAWLEVRFSPGADFGPWCGASLVSPQWLVTAAHCVAGMQDQPENFKVRVGSPDRTQGGDVRTVSEIKMNPGYGGGKPPAGYDPYGDDIALMKLSSPVPERPVRIALSPVPQPARLLGWGLMNSCPTGGDAPCNPVILQQLDTAISPAAACDTGSGKIQPSLELCALASSSKGFGGGDSGGPLLVGQVGSWALAGVVSHSPVTATDAAADIYTSVAGHFTWLISTMAG
jgi:secreted trypsin-like serine protease